MLVKWKFPLLYLSPSLSISRRGAVRAFFAGLQRNLALEKPTPLRTHNSAVSSQARVINRRRTAHVHEHLPDLGRILLSSGRPLRKVRKSPEGVRRCCWRDVREKHWLAASFPRRRNRCARAHLPLVVCIPCHSTPPNLQHAADELVPVSELLHLDWEVGRQKRIWVFANQVQRLDDLVSWAVESYNGDTTTPSRL